MVVGMGGLDLNLLRPLQQSGSIEAARERKSLIDLIAPALSLLND